MVELSYKAISVLSVSYTSRQTRTNCAASRTNHVTAEKLSQGGKVAIFCVLPHGGSNTLLSQARSGSIVM
jgi:hypothetical protein